MTVELATTCAVDGCDKPRRKRGWCGAHYQHWRRHGDVDAPFHHRWARERRCVVCGSTEWEGRRRKVCSGACQQMYQRHGLDRPASVNCSICGIAVDLTQRGPSGRIKRTDTRLCGRCRSRRALRHKQSVNVIGERDEFRCGLCGGCVDMKLCHPDPMSPSVDHIRPRAHGGTDEMGNLQLAHLTCNARKHARLVDALDDSSGPVSGGLEVSHV